MTLADVLRAFLEKTLFSQNITSAGGDSPKVNVLRDVDINPLDFEDLLREQVREIVEEYVSKDKEEISIPEIQSGSNVLSESGVSSTIKTSAGVLRNPASLVAMGLAVLPHAALVALAVSLAPMIIQELAKAGGLIDIRWKRMMQDEFNAFLDRQEQRDTQLGLRQVIVQSKAGFIVRSGAGMSENNLRQVREGGTDGDRLALIGLTDHSKELFGPLG